MRRVTWIALIALLFGPLPWVWRAAVDKLDEIERNDAEARATVAADAFLSLLKARIRVGGGGLSPDIFARLWMSLESDAYAVTDDPVDDALTTPEIMRVRTNPDLDPIEGLELLDPWVSRSRSLAGSEPAVRDVGSAQMALALIEGARLLARLGHSDRAEELLTRASPVAEPHPALARYLSVVTESLRLDPVHPGGLKTVGDLKNALRHRFPTARWSAAVRTGPTSLGELALLARAEAEYLDQTAASNLVRERAEWPLWQDALRKEDGEGLRLLRFRDRWFAVTEGRFLPGAPVDASAAGWRGDGGERIRFDRSRFDREPADRGLVIEQEGARGDISIDRPLFVSVPPQTLVAGMTSRAVTRAALIAYALIAALLLFAIAYQLRRGDRLVEARDDLIAQVAHELRTPLTVLRLYGESLLEGRVPPDARDEYLRGVGTETKRLGTLVDRMIRSVREDGLEDSNEEPVAVPLIDVAGLTERVVEDFDPVAKDRLGGVRFESTNRPSVRIAEDDLRMILEVLLDNGLKYGGDVPALDVQVGRRDGIATISVRDRGNGLGPGEEQKIFERFARGRAGRAASRGAGMGLYLARRAARGVGGDLALRNAEGGGAVAEVTLPVAGDAPAKSVAVDGASSGEALA